MTHSKSNIGTFRLVRNRVIQGLFVVLPLFITYVVIRWLYDTAQAAVLRPVSYTLRKIWKLEDDGSWLVDGLLGLAALGLVIGVLFIAGMFFRSRLHRMIDWVLLNVPFVNNIYSAVSNVFNAISSSTDANEKYKRVVLVEFPHPGMKAPAFVTGECIETNTGKTILSVYVPTTPVPTSGYMLLVEQENVVELNWDLEETLQAIVSGGISVPDKVTYHLPPPNISVENANLDSNDGTGSTP
ncbi:MAG: DUF502 domain-containing protein [Mariniblastus sp.]|nr:DUF502 domain-containing protein [Mariniblastus sp.]